MRLNKYTLSIENNNSTILYNLISKTLVEIPVSKSEIGGFISNLNIEETQFFINHLLISEDNNDDFQELVRIKKDFDNQTKVGHFIIHLGYSCNLNCSYCYQTTIDSADASKELDVDGVISFVVSTIDECDYEHLDICFMGGEPLLYWKKIVTISTAIRKHYRNDVLYSVITNGTLLENTEIVDQLYSCGISEYQVTLDGTKDVHDSLRNRNGAGSFDRIVNGLMYLSRNRKSIKVLINYNISSCNKTEIVALIHYLKDCGIDYPLSFSLVFDNGVNRSIELLGHNDIWLYAHRVALENGYTFDPMYRELYLGCAMTQKNYHIVGADGNLYKCINGVGARRYLLSPMSDYGSSSYESRLAELCDYSISRAECASCELYPICYGGCEYRNHLNGFRCDKDAFYRNDVQLIKDIVNAADRAS